MTQKYIDKTDLARMFAAVAHHIKEKSELLSQLDCISGDGDHGITMMRAATQLASLISPTIQQSLPTIFKDAGWRILDVDGGASSALLGTFFGGMAGSVPNETMDCNDLACALEAGLMAVSRQTKALPGDKTMMDALVPAVNAVRIAAEAGRSISTALREAATAAEAGAKSTEDQVARYGRARLLGARTRGHADAGATSIAIIFTSFSEAFSNERNY